VQPAGKNVFYLNVLAMRNQAALRLDINLSFIVGFSVWFSGRITEAFQDKKIIKRATEMSVGTILLIILILILIGALPTWGHSRGWGYGPSGILGIVVVVLLVLLLMGRL